MTVLWSEQIDKLAPALVKAIAEIPDVPKASKADLGKFKVTYANIADVLGVLRPILAKHDLTVMQPPTGNDGTVTTIVLHSSGQWQQSTHTVPPKDGRDAMAVGGAITYARRYALCAVFSIATDDDDGQTAAGRTQKPAANREDAPRAKAPAAQKPPATSEANARKAMFATFREIGYAGEECRVDMLGISSKIVGRNLDTSNDMNEDEVRQVTAKLKEIAAGRLAIGYTTEGELEFVPTNGGKQ